MDELLNEALKASDQIIMESSKDKLTDMINILEKAQDRIGALISENNLLIQQNEQMKKEIIYLRRSQEDRQRVANDSILFFKKNEESLLVQQKEQYEETLQRQLKMIETLIEDKKQLSQDVSDLQNEIHHLLTQLEKEKKLQDEKLRVLKEQLLAQESVKRQKWEKRKAVELREMTIKSLEPELQRLIDKHQLELKAVKQFYEQKLAEITFS